MESSAIVTRIEGQFALVEVSSVASGCGRCHEAGGCGSGLLNKSLRPRCNYRLPNLISAAVGDRVILSVPEGAVLRAALLAYLLPILLLIAGAAVGTVFSADDLVALIGAGSGLALGLLALRTAQSRLAGNGELLMTMRLENPLKNLD